MVSALSLLLVCFGGTSSAVETRFVQVHPAHVKEASERTAGQERAVVLIHGIRLHPFNSIKVGEPTFHDWQKAGSPLVKAIAKDADVFAYAYGQTAPVQTD